MASAAVSEPEASELGSILFGAWRSKVQNAKHLVNNIFNQHSLRAQWYIFDVQLLLQPRVRNLPREQGV